jgi:hypothetical protein
VKPLRRRCEAIKDRYPMVDRDVYCKRLATWSGKYFGGRLYYCGWCLRARKNLEGVTDWRRET